MKRIFCDCCGKEFQYDEMHKKVNGGVFPAVLQIQNQKLLSTRNKALEVEIKITFDFVNLANGAHIDACTTCRTDALIRQLSLAKKVEQPEGEYGRGEFI